MALREDVTAGALAIQSSRLMPTSGRAFSPESLSFGFNIAGLRPCPCRYYIEIGAPFLLGFKVKPEAQTPFVNLSGGARCDDRLSDEPLPLIAEG